MRWWQSKHGKWHQHLLWLHFPKFILVPPCTKKTVCWCRCEDCVRMCVHGFSRSYSVDFKILLVTAVIVIWTRFPRVSVVDCLSRNVGTISHQRVPSDPRARPLRAVRGPRGDCAGRGGRHPQDGLPGQQSSVEHEQIVSKLLLWLLSCHLFTTELGYLNVPLSNIESIGWPPKQSATAANTSTS